MAHFSLSGSPSQDPRKVPPDEGGLRRSQVYQERRYEFWETAQLLSWDNIKGLPTKKFPSRVTLVDMIMFQTCFKLVFFKTMPLNLSVCLRRRNPRKSLPNAEPRVLASETLKEQVWAGAELGQLRGHWCAPGRCLTREGLTVLPHSASPRALNLRRGPLLSVLEHATFVCSRP